MPTARTRSALLRRVQTPWSSLFFAAALAVSLAGLAARLGSDAVTSSRVGGWLRFDGLRRPGDSEWNRYYAAKSPGGSWRLVIDPDRSANAVAQEIAADPTAVVLIDPVWTDAATGFYDPVVRLTRRTVTFTRADGAPLPAEEILLLFRDLQGERAWWIAPERSLGPWSLSEGRAVQSSSLLRWNAVGNNALAATATLGLLWSFGWVPRLLRRRARARRLAKGLCPACAYDRRATPPHAPCPECGSPFLVDP